MSKIKLEELTETQLRIKVNELEYDIKTLSAIIEASNSTVFDLLINETKEEMKVNVGEESWKKLKENMKKIEQYRSIETTLQNQETLLERKKDELEEVKNAIKYRQTNLFDVNCDEVVETGFTFGDNLQPIETGDIYINEDSNPPAYYFIKKSADEKNFAIISNSYQDELLLNYPKNRELIEASIYIGNIFYGDDKENALRALDDMEKLIKGENIDTPD